MDMNLTNPLQEVNECHISKDWKLVQAVGGKKLIHARGCSFIADWELDGCREIVEFKPNKMKPCPTCGKLVFITLGAKDYVKNVTRYKAIFLQSGIMMDSIISFFRDSRAKVQLFGDRLFVHCRKDDWYIDLSLGECHLYHNNYRIQQREADGNFDDKGFHEHPLRKETQVERLNEAMRHISGYRYEEAEKAHAKKRKPRMTFTQYDESDPEYYGFK